MASLLRSSVWTTPYTIVSFRTSAYLLPGRLTAPSIPTIRLYGSPAPTPAKRSAPAQAPTKSGASASSASTKRSTSTSAKRSATSKGSGRADSQAKDFPIKLAPNRSKQQRGGRIKGISSYQEICFGEYALRALESRWITARQLFFSWKALRESSKHYPKKKMWTRIFPDKAVTARPVATRMGRGKGSPKCLAAEVKPGKILFEMGGGVSEKMARKALKAAAAVLPLQTQFITSERRC